MVPLTPPDPTPLSLRSKHPLPYPLLPPPPSKRISQVILPKLIQFFSFLPALFLLFHFLFISTTSFIITSLPPTPLSLFHFPLLHLLLSTLPFRGQQPSCPKYKLAFNFTSVIPLRSRKEHGASNRGRGPRYPCPLPCARAPPSVGVHSVYYDDRPRVFIWCT